MLSQKREYQSLEATEALSQASTSSDNDSRSTNLPTHFYSHFTDCMELHADAQKVSEYFNAHQAWFCRCAQPMKVELIGENGYALAIGRFGAFGYEVEPKVGLELLPSDRGTYHINTISVPNYEMSGYEVDFKAAMKLVEAAVSQDQSQHPTTRVEWQLDLTVEIYFPKFIHRLPKSLVQKTGDRLLHQIVRQVSRRLTYKVQEDFHQSLKREGEK